MYYLIVYILFNVVHIKLSPFKIKYLHSIYKYLQNILLHINSSFMIHKLEKNSTVEIKYSHSTLVI